MARPLRIERAGAWSHLTARGNERHPIVRDDRDRRAWYREYVEHAVREGLPECPWEFLTAQVALGGAEFVAFLRSNPRGDAKEQPSLRALQRDVTWDRVVRAVERSRGEAC